MNKCYLCQEEEETVDHICWSYCPTLFEIYHFVVANLRIIWDWVSEALHNKETLLSCHGSFVGKKSKKAWKTTPLCLFWIIWKERNKRAFDKNEKVDQVIKNLGKLNICYLCNGEETIDYTLLYCMKAIILQQTDVFYLFI